MSKTKCGIAGCNGEVNLEKQVRYNIVGKLCEIGFPCTVCGRLHCLEGMLALSIIGEPFLGADGKVAYRPRQDLPSGENT